MYNKTFIYMFLVFYIALSSSLIAADNNGKIVYVSNKDTDGQIYIINSDGSEEIRLTNSGDRMDSRPLWSPDGMEILFSGSESLSSDEVKTADIYIMNGDGKNLRRITSGKGAKEFAGWYPDGRKIIYSSNEGGLYKIYCMYRNGGGKMQLTYGKDEDMNPAVSPDGGSIVFESSRTEKNFEQEEEDPAWDENFDPDIPNGKQVQFVNDDMTKIYIMNVDGTNIRRLTNGQGRQARPIWGADGKKVYYFSGDEGSEMSICRIDPDGKNNEEWYKIPHDGRAGSIAWSGVGNSFILSLSADDTMRKHLVLEDAKSGVVTSLTKNNADDYDPSWQIIKSKNKTGSLKPSGGILKSIFWKNESKIVFASSRDEGVNLYIMNADGSLQQKITDTGSADHPSLSRDRKKITYIDYQQGSQIFIMNADGSNKKAITADTVIKQSPEWSPDGKKIAFCENREKGGSDLYVINADGGGLTRITNDKFYDNNPSWSPDGKKIVFTSTRGPNGKVFVVDADGKNEKQLTFSTDRENDDTPSWSPDCKKILFSRNYDFMTMNPDGTMPVKLKCTMKGWEACWSPDGRKIAFRPSSANEAVYIMNANGSNPIDITNSAPGCYNASWK